MTIDTISNLNKFFAYVVECANTIEKSVTKRSAEVQWRQERQRARLQLLKLSEHQLRDIGITRREAEAEAKRDFWD